MKRKTILLSIIGLALVNMIYSQRLSKEDVLGSYVLKEINYIYADTTINVNPSQDGFLILSPLRYTIAYNPGLNPRVSFQNLSNPTEEEILAGFKSFAFNGGSYEFENDVFTAHPDFAKVPGFEGGEQVYEVKQEGNLFVLTMFDETYPSGEKPSWYGNLKISLSFQKE